ncbi:Uncharacterised protein [Mycobacterium tuberculosis]|nr:Uncharacterised protein [Mycobacterium tuberculosis]
MLAAEILLCLLHRGIDGSFIDGCPHKHLDIRLFLQALGIADRHESSKGFSTHVKFEFFLFVRSDHNERVISHTNTLANGIHLTEQLGAQCFL